MASREFCKKRLERIKELADLGLTPKQISANVGISYRWVLQIVKRHGIVILNRAGANIPGPKELRRLRQTGTSHRELAERFNVHLSTMSGHLKRAGCSSPVPHPRREHKHLKERNDLIEEARKEGCTLCAIGERFGLTRQAVEQICKARNVKPQVTAYSERLSRAEVLLTSGRAPREVADALGVGLGTVYEYAKQIGFRLKPGGGNRLRNIPDVTVLADEWLKGATLSDLAEKYSCSRITVLRRLKAGGYTGMKNGHIPGKPVGPYKSISAASRATGVPFTTISHRLQRGLSWQEALGKEVIAMNPDEAGVRFIQPGVERG